MNTMRPGQGDPPAMEPAKGKPADDWEEWEDDECITPIDTAEQVLIQQPTLVSTNNPNSSKAFSIASRVSRQSTIKIQRLRSRKKSKAQKPKAGLKLITDMSTLRKNNHIAFQMKSPQNQPGPKFVDAAALKALEGEPTSASVGNWNWLKRNKNQSPASATPITASSALSPEDRPIMIGLSMSAVESSDDADHLRGPANNTRGPQQSVWSPDTPSTASSFSPGPRAASSLYSQTTGHALGPAGSVPPVPAVPGNYAKSQNSKIKSQTDGALEDDSMSPHTLFEEDGVSSPHKNGKGKPWGVTPDSATSRSYGWWDHVVTPFADKHLTFSSRKQKMDSPQDNGKSPHVRLAEWSDAEPSPSLLPKPLNVQTAPIIRVPTPKRTPPPEKKGNAHFNPFETAEASSSRVSPALPQHYDKEKAGLATDDGPHDQPPPYSPPQEKQEKQTPKFCAVLPPIPLSKGQFPPSPGLGSPGLAATMTSQGATPLSSMQSFPTQLPARPLGTYLPQEHLHDAPNAGGDVERTRRRHEKEEVAARKVGGFWRGRGCIPETGCFGRTGREGRKRRRVCLGIAAGVMALLILIIVLAVVLTRPQESNAVETMWVNLTDFPPMPTGVLTVVGPENKEAINGCTSPETLWSCSLPKDDQDSVAPYDADQPTVIMQIQWDNSSRKSWQKGDEEAPEKVSRRGMGMASVASRHLWGKRVKSGFTPNPDPPEFKEMFFLGDTTDNVTSEDKGGEATPFYISLLESVNAPVDGPKLQKRQRSNGKNGTGLFEGIEDAITPPELEDDGTPVKAKLLPTPVQQPVRLYDRGKPTEHYGFYTYFRRTIFLKSVDRLNDTEDGDIPIDEDGGCRKTEANFLATWQETRLLVRIWTKKLEKSQLLVSDDDDTGIDGTEDLIRPGTMPYPVTVTLDTHGGDPKKKLVFEWPMDDRQQLDLNGFKALANNLSFGGKVVNPRGSRKDSDDASKFGGFDGGSGGCRCEWVNWS